MIENIDRLAEAFLCLKNKKECKSFLRDICTLTEVEAMSERLSVVFMLDDKIPYREISEKIGVSTTTVTRVSHWLKYGTGSYKLILKRLKGLKKNTN